MPDRRDVTDMVHGDGTPLQVIPPDTAQGGDVTTAGTTANVDLQGAVLVRVATAEDAYLNFGDNTVTAAAGDIWHPAGTELYAVPRDATHMAYIQDATGGKLNWRKMGA